MTRKYQPIWESIKAVDPGTEVAVKVHGTAEKTLRQAVLKEKSRETAIRKKLQMPRAGKLEIRVQTDGVNPNGYVIVYFKLDWDMRKL